MWWEGGVMLPHHHHNMEHSINQLVMHVRTNEQHIFSLSTSE